MEHGWLQPGEAGVGPSSAAGRHGPREAGPVRATFQAVAGREADAAHHSGPGGPFGAVPASLPSAPALPGAMAGHPSMPKVRDRKQGRTRQNERGKKEPQAVIIDQGRPLPRTFH